MEEVGESEKERKIEGHRACMCVLLRRYLHIEL